LILITGGLGGLYYLLRVRPIVSSVPTFPHVDLNSKGARLRGQI
jgi:hypothetical protein